MRGVEPLATLHIFFAFAKDEKLDRLTPAARRAVSLLRTLSEPQADPLVRGLEAGVRAAQRGTNRRETARK